MENKLKEWWIPVVIGILLVAISFIFMVRPVETFVGLSILFAFSIFLIGGSYTAFALKMQKLSSTWGWYLLLGVLNLVLGAALLFQPDISMQVFVLYIGFWLIFQALHSIHYSLELKKINFSSWWVQMLFGVVELVFGFLIIINPVLGVVSIVYLTAIPIMFVGVAAILFGLKLKGFEF